MNLDPTPDQEYKKNLYTCINTQVNIKVFRFGIFYGTNPVPKSSSLLKTKNRKIF